ncbi:MAG TPA: asparagine synthase (glutamine-hydrolyzing) [Vicinamibacterales bacterium]|nr:asparagine synthase (glutamine-hydrolyzing) [Vicinamibacterales bacterium]
MCGICGELRFDGAPVEPAALTAMRDRIAHRGPDHANSYLAGQAQAGLGFRRLKIIDLSAVANQPMANEDASIQVVFNGEIYNYLDLRADLVARGHQFRSRSDTETIVHLYEEYGSHCIERLDGMFGLAIWDEPKGVLVLARDRAGKKPLFYHADGKRVLFSSEMKAFLGHPSFNAEIDRDAVAPYFLYGYVPGPRTWYRGVNQVEPGGVITFDRSGEARSRKYWSLVYPRQSEVRDVARAEATARVRELVVAAVKRRLMSDVPLGAFLSGGVDSTVVVGVMRELGVSPLNTFSIGFEGDASYDETAEARRTAERFGAKHTEFRVKPSAIDLLDTLIWHHDGAFGDSSAMPTYMVAKLTREHVTVALNGDGGDEVFAGYLRFRAAAMAAQIPAPLRGLASSLLQAVPAGPNDRHWRSRAARFGKAIGLPLHERVTRWNSYFDADLEELVGVPNIDRLQHIRGVMDGMEGRSALSQLLLANFSSYLADDLLVKADRCTMANSLEARSPFLDRELMEYVATLPDHFKLDGSRTKAILRDAFADIIPREIDRRPKTGFGVPLDTWFRGELRELAGDILLSPNAKYRDYISADVVTRTLHRHWSGDGNDGQRLWALITFERWLQLLPTFVRGSLQFIPA